MDQREVAEQLAPPPQPAPDEPIARPAAPAVPESSLSASFVFALGQVDPRFPSLAVEKEFAQVTGRADTAGQTDRQALQTIFADRANRYLARQMCWVFTIEGLETYLLAPRDPADFELLIEAVRPRPHPSDVDVIIGAQGPIALPEACNGLMIPIVVFGQMYSFDRDQILSYTHRRTDVTEKYFVRVDVTEEFPFLVTKLSPFYER